MGGTDGANARSARPSPTLLEPRGHRAIGAVSHPEYGKCGNYVPTMLPHRYDAFLYLYGSHALHALPEVRPHEEGEVPETYLSGL